MEDKINGIAEYLAKDIANSSYTSVQDLEVKIRTGLKLLLDKTDIGKKNAQIGNKNQEIHSRNLKLEALKSTVRDREATTEFLKNHLRKVLSAEELAQVYYDLQLLQINNGSKIILKTKEQILTSLKSKA